MEQAANFPQTADSPAVSIQASISVSIPDASVFCTAALASGLLDESLLRATLAELRDAPADSPAPLVEIGDDQLAAHLVERGKLNPWQAEQLKAGRSKFNLGPYHIIDSIGQGGMGQVFKAEHSLMGRVVAIKVLPKNKSTPETIAGFSQEIRAQAQLDHDNLVRAYDAGHDGNVYYLVCEYVPGCDLRQLVKAKGKLSQREAATIISQAAAGLAHAHEIGLVHRDAKPGNILVTPEGKTKVSDLGLAGFLHGDETDARRGKIVGTADYLAPEQIINPLVVQPVSDIYSLGCSMYFAITGNVPYPGGTTRDKCHRHCNDTPLNPRRFNPNLSDDFLDVLADMMAKEPGERIATAMEVCQRLERWADLAVTNPLPVRERSWARPPLPPLPAADEQDSQPTFADYPADREQDAPSQASQRTDPVSQDMQDTKPGIDRPQPRRRPPRTQPPRLPEPSQPAGGDGEWLLWVAAALAVLALAAGGGVALLTWLW